MDTMATTLATLLPVSDKFTDKIQQLYLKV